jgi:2-polyprenyl-6-methoxyphenol hydroxylase-like FAD-dependent oxidoreductase
MRKRRRDVIVIGAGATGLAAARALAGAGARAVILEVFADADPNGTVAGAIASGQRAAEEPLKTWKTWSGTARFTGREKGRPRRRIIPQVMTDPIVHHSSPKS